MSETDALALFLAARAERGPQPAREAGSRACARLTALLDAALSSLAASLLGGDIAVVAVGGYGRREQSRHSDVDLMLLAERAYHEEATALLYPLWDAKLAVGHSVRDVGQTVEAARQSVETATALLDARLVCGDARIFARFVEARRQAARRAQRSLAAELEARRRERIAGERWQLASPHLKAGRGGLRDFHTVRWLDALDAVDGDGGEPAEPAPELASARETLLATRTALHALSDRPNDRLYHDAGPAVASWLGEENETWGRRVLHAMRTIDAASAARLERAEPRRASGPRRWWGALGRGRGASSSPPAAAGASEGQADAPGQLAAALSALGARGGDAGHEDASAAPLDPLPPAAWLAELLPEWEGIRCRQHAVSFHLHPVDVHSACSVAEVWRASRIEEEDTGTVEAAAALDDEALLLLAALLHDIGKGDSGDHAETGAAIAERVARRLRLDAGRSRRLIAAVRHHLLLPTIAIRRDIADTRVIAEVARAVSDARTLHLLYVLAVADARATGPEAWGRWKAQLMRLLYYRVLARIEEGRADETAAEAELARRDATIAQVAALEGAPPAAVIRRHVDGLPPPYVLTTPPAEIAAHLALIEGAAGASTRTALSRSRSAGVERLTIVTRDRPGVLATLAGTLASHSVTVLGGACYTRDDGWAIDVVSVDDALGHGIDAARWRRIEENIPPALAGQFPIDQRLTQTRATYGDRPRARNGEGRRVNEPAAPSIAATVRVDNAAADRYSVVEVSVADRPGILYAIARAINGLSLDIYLAKVDTWGAEVVDTFYVQGEGGRRVTQPDQIERLRTAVTEAIADLDIAPDGSGTAR
ncbi:MAG: HD domain-containing protein [Chloroflexi bacterium]|nr:HD domain-containing protein [Chloroflexota bacterium]